MKKRKLTKPLVTPEIQIGSKLLWSSDWCRLVVFWIDSA